MKQSACTHNMLILVVGDWNAPLQGFLAARDREVGEAFAKKGTDLGAPVVRLDYWTLKRAV